MRLFGDNDVEYVCYIHPSSQNFANWCGIIELGQGAIGLKLTGLDLVYREEHDANKNPVLVATNQIKEESKPKQI